MAMQAIVTSIVEDIQTWEGVTVTPHRFGGQQFNLANVEIGHIHQHGLVDVPFTRSVRAALVAEERAEPHHILPESGWVSYYLRHEADARGALWLYRLSWLLKQRGRTRKDPAARAALNEQLHMLEPGDKLAAALRL